MFRKNKFLQGGLAASRLFREGLSVAGRGEIGFPFWLKGDHPPIRTLT